MINYATCLKQIGKITLCPPFLRVGALNYLGRLNPITVMSPFLYDGIVGTFFLLFELPLYSFEPEKYLSKSL